MPCAVKRDKKKIKKLWLLKYAPYFETFKELYEKLGIAERQFFRYMDDPEYYEQMHKVRGTMTQHMYNIVPYEKFVEQMEDKGEVEMTYVAANKRKKTAYKKVKTTSKTIKVKIPVTRKGTKKERHTTRDERVVIGSQICDLVGDGVDLEKACEIFKVALRTFYTWIRPEAVNYSQPVEILYREARLRYRRVSSDLLTQVSRKSLLVLSQEKEWTETTRIGRVQTDKNTGETTVVPSMVKQVTKKRDAQFAAVKFVLGTLDEDFSPQQAEKAKEGEQEVKFVTDAELDKKIEEAKKRAGLVK